MAIIGPFIPSDIDVLAIANVLRTQSVAVGKTAAFNILPREAETYILSGSAAITATLPAANSTDLKVGARFLVINDASATATINFNTSGSLGTVPAGESGLIVLKTNADANGTWELISLDAANAITKFTMNFNADAAPTANASWTAASNGAHTFVVAGSTHGRGNFPIVTTYVTATGDDLIVDTSRNTTNGDVTLTVTSVPSGLFAGTVIII